METDQFLSPRRMLEAWTHETRYPHIYSEKVSSRKLESSKDREKEKEIKIGEGKMKNYCARTSGRKMAMSESLRQGIYCSLYVNHIHAISYYRGRSTVKGVGITMG